MRKRLYVTIVDLKGYRAAFKPALHLRGISRLGDNQQSSAQRFGMDRFITGGDLQLSELPAMPALHVISKFRRGYGSQHVCDSINMTVQLERPVAEGGSDAFW